MVSWISLISLLMFISLLKLILLSRGVRRIELENLCLMRPRARLAMLRFVPAFAVDLPNGTKVSWIDIKYRFSYEINEKITNIVAETRRARPSTILPPPIHCWTGQPFWNKIVRVWAIRRVHSIPSQQYQFNHLASILILELQLLDWSEAGRGWVVRPSTILPPPIHRRSFESESDW